MAKSLLQSLWWFVVFVVVEVDWVVGVVGVDGVVGVVLVVGVDGRGHKYRSAIVCPTYSINRGTPNTNRSSTPIKTKTNHVAVIETLSTTFHFLRAFLILVILI